MDSFGTSEWCFTSGLRSIPRVSYPESNGKIEPLGEPCEHPAWLDELDVDLEF